MSAELDLSQYIDLFLQEAEEQIEILEQETLGLEQDPTDGRLQVIFRAAHTLKGSSRAMGFSRFAELTHEMENILDQLRQHTLAVTTEIADCLLATIDTLAKMKETIASGQGDAVECAGLVAQLQAIGGTAAEVGSAGGRVATPAGGGVVAEQGFISKVDAELFDALDEAAGACGEGSAVWHVRFRLAKDCVMKFVRAFMAVSAAQEGGEILVCVPDQEALEEEAFDTDFEFVFHSVTSEGDLRAKFGAIGEVEEYWLGAWSRPESVPVLEAEGPAGGGEVKLSLVESSSGAGQVEAGGVAPSAVGEALAVGPGAPASAAAGSAAAAGSVRKTETGQTVRVDVARLDTLMNLVGELVIDRTRIAQIGNDLSQRFSDPNIDALSETVSHIARITGDLQDQIMKARMMPIETVFNRFPRVMRDLAQKLGKDVKLELVGGETELDRSVIEVIGDPLLHILRNSVDHGIEKPEIREGRGKPRQGTVTVSAKHQENHIVIEIVDDGKGIDAERVKAKAVEAGHVSRDAAERMTEKEALQLIFASGLSTAAEVSEVSGRGVGMDIVRSNIQKLGGIIDLDTTPGHGSRFSLRLPLTLAIIRGLLVAAAQNVFVIPLGSVVETLLIRRGDVQRINQREVVVIRGMTTPLVWMSDVFGTGSGRGPGGDMYVVIVGLAEQRLGLVVDGLIGEQEVVIKSMSRFCGEVPGVSGATILGDGNVALILDVNGVVQGERV